MAFVKTIKTRSYFKRFQTKFRRRREGKTDYFARKRMITQDKNKYDTPKYRLVVRFTNTKVIAQIAYATIQGDKVVTQANSNELRKYGLTAGLSNYSASYATGLLVARRLLKLSKLDTLYKGVAKIDGADYDVSADVKDDQRKPFKAILDAGLINTTKGNKVFAVMKGASDGGLHVPHSTGKFPGTGADGKYNAAVHRERIFGVHIQKYMKELKDESVEDYNAQFKLWDKCLKDAKVDTCEKLYTKIFDEIRKNPDAAAKKKVEKKPIKYSDKRKTIVETGKGKYKRDRRFTYDERKQRVHDKIKKALGK